MIYKAPAKINIGLDITGVRDDGYHLLDMVMQTIDVFDELDITGRDDGRIVITCDDPMVPTDERNLIYKAARALTDEGINVKLIKHIPSQAGMGGGSSDAATTLKAVNEIFGLGKSDSELESLAASLGADVPFFIKGGRQRCRGIGEILDALTPLKKYCVFIKPDACASTKEIYAEYDRLKPKLSGDVINVLEPVTAAKFPIITELKNRFKEYGAETASMTGSGTAVFGLFEDKDKAQLCASEMGGILCQTY